MKLQPLWLHPSLGSSMLQKQSRLTPYFAAKLERSVDSIRYLHSSGIDSLTPVFFRINSFTRKRSKYSEKIMKGNNESGKIKLFTFFNVSASCAYGLVFGQVYINLQNLSEKKWLLLHFLHKCIIRIRSYNKFCNVWKKKGLYMWLYSLI